MSGKTSLERRIKDLEVESGIGSGQYVLRIIFYLGVGGKGSKYREVRCLMADDGTPKGRYIRTLNPGETVPGIDNPPWLKIGDEDPEEVTRRGRVSPD